MSVRRTARNVWQDSPASRAVEPAVQHAIDKAVESAYPQVRDALEPFGLTPADILVPVYRQVIYEDEAPIYTSLFRNWDIGVRGSA